MNYQNYKIIEYINIQYNILTLFNYSNQKNKKDLIYGSISLANCKHDSTKPVETSAMTFDASS